MIKFPNGFLWGTATAAYQIEGNNKNSDWWDYEQSKIQQNRTYPLEPSGLACDSYNRYEEDFDLCVALNNNAVRISIEWARIEPKEGEFDLNEIEHYRKVLKAAKDRGLKTFVTLHHFTSPMWLAKKGGWHSISVSKHFKTYTQKVVAELDTLIDVYLTINEPQVYALLAYKGVYDWERNDIARWPPAKTNLFLSLVVQINFMLGHARAYKTIKKLHPEKPVGIVQNITLWDVDEDKSTFWDKVACKVLNFIGREFFLLPIYPYLDLIGLNYYFTNFVVNLQRVGKTEPATDLGWYINPNGLERVLLSLKRYNLPVYITENGLADAKDIHREKFLHDHLLACSNAIAKGVDLRGYFYWSLIDNYEWHQGFWPRFGLCEIERDNNLKRTKRKSFYYYAQIAKQNGIEA